MRRAKVSVPFLTAMMLASALPASAIVVDLHFHQPVATTFDSAGYLYVLDFAGTISKVKETPRPSIVATFGSKGTGNGQLSGPQDLATDHDGNIVVADMGNIRLEVFTTGGAFVRTAACAEAPQRVVVSPDGTLYALEFTRTGLVVERFDTSYRSLGTFDASGACGVRSTPSYTAALAVDASGYVWVADELGCGENYTLRRYTSAGASAGSWSRPAGELDSDTLADSDYQVMLIADIVTSGRNLYVFMGTGGGKTGERHLDVWTTGGRFVKRVTFSGPAKPMVRGTVHGGDVYVSDRFGNTDITRVSLQGL